MYDDDDAVVDADDVVEQNCCCCCNEVEMMKKWSLEISPFEAESFVFYGLLRIQHYQLDLCRFLELGGCPYYS